MSEQDLHLFKLVIISVFQVGLPVLGMAYFLFLEKNEKTRLIGVGACFLIFGILSYGFAQIPWDGIRGFLETASAGSSDAGDNALTRHQAKMQASLKADPKRATDALEQRGARVSAQMYRVYQASKSAHDRAVLDKIDIDLSHLRGEYITLGLDPSVYTKLMDELETMTDKRIPTSEEEVAWNNQILAAQEENQHRVYVVDTAPSRKANPTVTIVPDDGILAFYVATEKLLIDRRFDELENEASDFRKTNARFLGGDEKLSDFYVALGAIKGETCSCHSGFESQFNFDDKDSAVRAWLVAKPDSGTARLVSAGLLVSYAWLARGHGYSNSVTPEQWTAFGERLIEARTVMAGVDPKLDPEVYALKASFALQGDNPRGELDAIMQEAIETFPQHYPFYGSRADHLQTKWYGKPGEVQEFTRSLLDPSSGETGQIAYTYVADDLYNAFRLEDLFEGSGLDWGDLKKAFALREARYGLNRREWNILMKLAVAAEDKVYAGTALAHIGENWDLGVWRNHDTFALAVSWLNAPD